MQDNNPKGDTALDQQARDIFLDAIEVQGLEARAAFLDKECQHNSSLRERVDALLENHRDDTFLESAINRARPNAIDPPHSLKSLAP